MNTHTPGPWNAVQTPESGYFEWTVRGERLSVGVDTDNAKADARLIAAAPELLAALQVVAALQIEPGAITTGKPLRLAIDAAIAAITKAAA